MTVPASTERRAPFDTLRHSPRDGSQITAATGTMPLMHCAPLLGLARTLLPIGATVLAQSPQQSKRRDEKIIATRS